MTASTSTQLSELLIHPGESIRTALGRIDSGTVAIALMVDTDGRLLGTVSDGDIRRALLGGATLDDPVDPYLASEPVVVPADTDRAAVLDLMRARRLSQIPVLDDQGTLLGLHVMHEVLGASPKPNCAVVLAGGRGTRLGDLTANTPKPMLTVAGRPILERLVLHLVGSGIQRIFLSVNYHADQIREHFGDGSDLGCSIEYLSEELDAPLGTGGPLRLLLDLDAPPAEPILVMNGDLVASFAVEGLLATHEETSAAMTVALTDYRHDVPFGIAHLDRADDRLIERIEEKPRWTGLANAGIYAVSPAILDAIPRGTTYPITELIGTCLRRGYPVAGWPLADEWQDIGRPHDLARARGDGSHPDT